jgi:16S rRNA (guanine527-N7)-methyltransferase
VPAQDHEVHLAALGIESRAIGPLAHYLDLVARFGARTNLTGARTASARTADLVAAVLGARPFVRGDHLLDIGSGNGSPGLVLHLLERLPRTTLLEPRQRRWAFLREAARELGLAGVDVERTRHDAYHGPPATTITLRAVALAPADVCHLSAPAAHVLVWRPREPAPPGLHVLGGWPGGTALGRST